MDRPVRGGAGNALQEGLGVYLRAGRSRSSRPASRGADAKVRMPKLRMRTAVAEKALLMTI
jgi:hypothetical protein